jgi:hypothetical protein
VVTWLDEEVLSGITVLASASGSQEIVVGAVTQGTLGQRRTGDALSLEEHRVQVWVAASAK